MNWVYLACVVIATVVTLIDVNEHVQRFNFPKIQVYTVRVIMMVPVYGVLSYLSLNLPAARFFLDTVRDTYEAIVLYMFFIMLIEYGGGEGQLIRALNKKKYKGIHTIPMCFLPLFNLDQAFFLRCKRMVLQFAIWKPCASLVACILEPMGYYRESDYNLDNAYLYIYIMYNITLSYSLYYLVLFEIETEKELRYCKAAMKFLCIKSLIFFAFWQSMVITMLVSMGVLYVGPEEEAEHVTTVMVNGLICLELLPVAYLHHYAFSREKLGWEMAAQPVFNIETEQVSAGKALDMALTFDGVLTDLIATVFYRKGKLLDMEHVSDEEGEGGADAAAAGGGKGSDVGGVFGRRGNANNGGAGKSAGVMDPTVDELVQFAFNNDRGIRPEGLIYVPDSSDEDMYDDDVEYGDTDIIDPNFSVKTAREGAQAALDNALATAAIDMVMASGGTRLGGGGSSKGKGAGSPSGDNDADNAAGAAAEMLVFCSVCGRFDRDLVKRKDNYKCVECVGTKSIKELKNANRAFAGAISKAVNTVVDVSIKGVEGISGGAINIDKNKNAEYKFKDEEEMERQELH